MPKLKTHKAVSKRFKITKKKKYLKRAAGQDHFNSRDRGVKTNAKRRDVEIAKTELKTLKNLTPYN